MLGKEKELKNILYVPLSNNGSWWIMNQVSIRPLGKIRICFRTKWKYSVWVQFHTSLKIINPSNKILCKPKFCVCDNGTNSGDNLKLQLRLSRLGLNYKLIFLWNFISFRAQKPIFKDGCNCNVVKLHTICDSFILPRPLEISLFLSSPTKN